MADSDCMIYLEYKDSQQERVVVFATRNTLSVAGGQIDTCGHYRMLWDADPSVENVVQELMSNSFSVSDDIIAAIRINNFRLWADNTIWIVTERGVGKRQQRRARTPVIGLTASLALEERKKFLSIVHAARSQK